MDEKKDKYDLYTEKVKEKFSVKYKYAIEICKLFVAAVFVGVVASIVFLVIIRNSNFESIIIDEGRKEVEITLDSDEEVIEQPSREPDNYEMDIKNNENVEKPSNVDGEDEVPLEFHVSEIITDILDEINPSLVTITAIDNSEDLLFATRQNTTQLRGIIIADNEVEYLILTDISVAGVDSIQVTFAGDVTCAGELVMSDSTTNLAIVAVERRRLTYTQRGKIAIATMGNSNTLNQGDLLVASGNLYGVADAINYGIVTSLSQIATEADSRHKLVYTNMVGDKDNSGFIFNDRCELIGIISGKYSNEGLVCYGISDLKLRIQNLLNKKKIAYLGVVTTGISEEVADANGMPSGVYVTGVEINSPAYFAGIVNGDIISKVNDHNIANVYNLEKALCELEVGSQVSITVNRRGRNGYSSLEYIITVSEKK